MMKRICQIIPFFSLLLVVFMIYANSVDDLDFWWHLRHGQFIYETHSIPDRDHFSYTAEISVNMAKIGEGEIDGYDFLPEDSDWYRPNSLKRNWMSQVFFYLVYLSGGFTAIGILKSAVFVLAFFILYMAMLERGAGRFSSFLVLCLIALIGADFNYSRPQIFSFLMFSCVLYALYGFRNEKKVFYMLPAVMLLWANLHGGFILGVVIILAFTFAEILKYMLHNRLGLKRMSCLDAGRLRILSLFTLISALISLLNPNGYKTFLLSSWLHKKSTMLPAIEEYHRPMLYEYHAYWLMLFLVAVFGLVMLVRKRLDLTDLVISSIVIIPSLISIRYIIFFALGTGVLLAGSMTYGVSVIKEMKPFNRMLEKPVFSGTRAKNMLSLFLTTVLFAVLIKTGATEKFMRFNMRYERYPTGAVEFIREKIPKANMFNVYNWGGYLTWNLYPDYKVFIYGQPVNYISFFHYNLIINAEKGKKADLPLWKRLLDAYDVNFILTNAVNSRGHIVPLVGSLYKDINWELVYADGKSMVFVRDVQENRDIIRDLYISKDRVYNEIISECLKGIDETPATWGYYETLGFTYMKKNRHEEALAMFRKYLTMNPANKRVRNTYDLLKRYMEKYGMSSDQVSGLMPDT